MPRKMGWFCGTGTGPSASAGNFSARSGVVTNSTLFIRTARRSGDFGQQAHRGLQWHIIELERHRGLRLILQTRIEHQVGAGVSRQLPDDVGDRGPVAIDCDSLAQLSRDQAVLSRDEQSFLHEAEAKAVRREHDLQSVAKLHLLLRHVDNRHVGIDAELGEQRINEHGKFGPFFRSVATSLSERFW